VEDTWNQSDSNLLSCYIFGRRPCIHQKLGSTEASGIAHSETGYEPRKVINPPSLKSRWSIRQDTWRGWVWARTFRATPPVCPSATYRLNCSTFADADFVGLRHPELAGDKSVECHSTIPDSFAEDCGATKHGRTNHSRAVKGKSPDSPHITDGDPPMILIRRGVDKL